jgi:hypothetical protein
LAQLSIAAYLLGILGTTLYMVLTGWRTATSAWVAEALLLFVMPAVVYQMGFFHYIPELLAEPIMRPKPGPSALAGLRCCSRRNGSLRPWHSCSGGGLPAHQSFFPSNR